MLIFFSFGPIVKFAHFQKCNLACLYCLQETNPQDCFVGNGQILQWELISKIVHTKCMFIHARGSGPKSFAKFGWKTRTFSYHKKNGLAICQTWVRRTIGQNLYIALVRDNVQSVAVH